MRHIKIKHIIFAVIFLTVGYNLMSAFDNNKPAIQKAAMNADKWGRR